MWGNVIQENNVIMSQICDQSVPDHNNKNFAKNDWSEYLHSIYMQNSFTKIILT